MASRVVLITAALTDVGRASALAFAKEGARIVVSGGRDEAGQQLVAKIRALGSEAEFIRADVRHGDEVRELIDKTVARFGSLDVAVNIAGTKNEPGSVTEQSAEPERYASADNNVLGTLLSMIHQLEMMLLENHGSIINVASIQGQIAAGTSIYIIDRHAVVGLTASAPPEPGVRMNAIDPRPFVPRMYTKFTAVDERQRGLVSTAPLFLLGSPEEIARRIVFLASD
jgi:NAD(P)-dependent dehydrogenase (short-subunit alcohol dehydrogenase family)